MLRVFSSAKIVLSGIQGRGVCILVGVCAVFHRIGDCIAELVDNFRSKMWDVDDGSTSRKGRRG